MPALEPLPVRLGPIEAVVVNFNGGELLRACLESVAAEGLAFVVVDNASEDDSCAIVPADRLVRNDENRGFAAAVNQGVRASSPQAHLLLVNPDARLLPGAVDRLSRAMADSPKASCAGPSTMDDANRLVVSARRFPGPELDLVERLRATRLLPTAQRRQLVQGPLLLRAPVPVRVDWISGACLLIRREAWDSVGSFSEEFFLYGEELDWCWRAARRGWHALYVPEAGVVHPEEPQLQQCSTFPRSTDAPVKESGWPVNETCLLPDTGLGWRSSDSCPPTNLPGEVTEGAM